MAKYPSYYVRPDGLHETIIRVNGKRKAFRGKTDREVWEKVKAFDRSQAAKPLEKTTFAQVADAWWTEIEPTLAHNTTKGYKPALRRAIDEFGTTAVAEITAKDIDRYIKDFSAGRARKTVTTQLQVIRQILRKAQLEGAIQFNPAEAVRPPKGLPQQRREAPDRDQIQKIKDGVGLPFGLFAALVYYTGCRRGEALALKGEDIDRKNRVVRIRRSIYHVGNSPHVKEPKTEKGLRTVPLLTALDELLPDRLPSGYLFPGENGEPMKNGRFIIEYNKYRKSSGVTVAPHQIRHGYATALYEAKIDAKTAQTLLGHAQLSTTMDIYTHVCQDQLTAAAEQMEKGF